MSNIQRPYAYEKVVRDKESAKQNIQVAIQERPRILTAAKTKKREAQTQANITLNKVFMPQNITLLNFLLNFARVWLFNSSLQENVCCLLASFLSNHAYIL